MQCERPCSPIVVVCIAGLTTETRNKIGPLLTTTGPHGYVQKCIVDLERKAARCCFYVHDALFHEYVLPLDVDAPVWSFSEKFATVYIDFKFLFQRESTRCIFSAREHNAERAICYPPSVCPSVCLSRRWINRKRLKLGSCNFDHTVAPSL